MGHSSTRFLFVIPTVGLIGFLSYEFLVSGTLELHHWFVHSQWQACLRHLENSDWPQVWIPLSQTFTGKAYILAALTIASLLGIKHFFRQSKQNRLESAFEIEELHRKANRLGDMGLACSESGKIENAIDYYKQALAISRQIGDIKVTASTLGNLGNACQALGKVQNAIRYHEQSLAIFRQMNDYNGVGSVLGNLGKAYLSCGQIDKAIKYNKQSVTVLEKINSPYAPQMRKWVSELEKKYY